MNRISRAAFAALTFATSACGSGAVSVSPRVLAAADPSAAESKYVAPTNPLEDRRPRTLALEIEDPTRMHHAEKVPEVGTPQVHHGTEAQTVYACPMHPEVRDTKPSTCPKCGMKLEPVKDDAKPTPTPSPRPTASPTATPTATPGGHEHHHGSTL